GRGQPGAVRQVRPPAPRLGPALPSPPAGAGPGPRAADGAGSATLARPEPDLRLRRGGRLAPGPVGLDLRLVPRGWPLGGAQGDRDPGRARRPGAAAA